MKHLIKKELERVGEWENAEFVWEYTPKNGITLEAWMEYMEEATKVSKEGKGGMIASRGGKFYLFMPQRNKKVKFAVQ